MFGKGQSGLSQKTWSRMQFLYFFIAFANLMATVGSIYLGQLLITLHEKSLDETTVFQQQLKKIHLLKDATRDVGSAYANSVETGVFTQAISLQQSSGKDYRGTSDLLRKQVPQYHDAASAQHTLPLLDRLDAEMGGLQKTAEAVAQAAVQGDSAAAKVGAAKLSVDYATLPEKIDALSATIDSANGSSAAHLAMAVAKLRRYEVYIGMFLAIVICFGAFYGYFMGRLMKRKFAEMERTNRHLDEAHQQAMAFSKEIQTINSDMGTLNRQLSDNLTKLREAQDDALRKGKMAQLGNLTATVAHELRNPLSTVRTSAYLLARKIKDKGLDVDPQLLRINNGIIRCDNIITQLLDFSRSKAVKAEPTVLDVWLEKLVQAEAQKLPEIVSIECYFGLGDMLVDVEPGRLERAIINLLYNASEALVGKGDDPKARYRNDPVIRIVSRMTERGAEVAVSDNGPGISAENLAKIREPLFTTKNFGTGLGIPAVEQILEQHNGGLEITSVEGQGASFTLWLPVHTKVGEQAA
jgi:signal transduction histidine kinase